MTIRLDQMRVYGGASYVYQLILLRLNSLSEIYLLKSSYIILSNWSKLCHPVRVLVELTLADWFAHISYRLCKVLHCERNIDLVLYLSNLQDIYVSGCDLLS